MTKFSSVSISTFERQQSKHARWNCKPSVPQFNHVLATCQSACSTLANNNCTCHHQASTLQHGVVHGCSVRMMHMNFNTILNQYSEICSHTSTRHDKSFDFATLCLHKLFKTGTASICAGLSCNVHHCNNLHGKYSTRQTKLFANLRAKLAYVNTKFAQLQQSVGYCSNQTCMRRLHKAMFLQTNDNSK